MAEILYRAFAAEMEVRSGGDGRTVFGPAVPFDLPVRIDGSLVEEWDRHAFDHQMRAIHRVPFFDLHGPHGGHRVGKLTMARADPQHLYIEARVDDYPEGDAYLDNVRAGRRPHFSIGFEEAKTEPRGNVSRRVKARLIEVAGVPEGAFGPAASVAGVRAVHQGDTCPTCRQTIVVVNSRARVDSILASLPVLPPSV